MSNSHIVASELQFKYEGLALASANEAETRIKLIDRILFEVLGWTHDDVSVEERVSEDGRSTYADYIFRTANAAFVVEAKKVGATFDNAGDKRRAKLRGALMAGDTGDAIRQARDYCRKTSIQFGVVTNGAQWIVFPAVRVDQISFEDSSAIVFDSLETILGEEYEDFCELLSRDGVINGHLGFELLGRTADQIEERRLATFYTSTGRTRRNPIYPLIQDAINLAFTDSIIQSDDELLSKCYVSSVDRIRFDRRIKMHLQAAESLFKTQPKKPLRRKHESKALADTLESAVAKSRPLAILVLGTVGAGKTTYLNYSRRITAADFFEPKTNDVYPQWLEIDFRNHAAEDSSLDFVYRTMQQYIQSEPLLSDWGRAVRPSYAQEIESLRRGPLALIAGNEEEFDRRIAERILRDYEAIRPYVDRILMWCSKHAPVFLVIDNVDQFEDIDKQSRIFADCIALATRLRIHLVISMRESTYVGHRHSATFDAFDFDAIQIEPPKIAPVLSKRFLIARNLLKGRPGQFRSQTGPLFKTNDLSQFMDVVQSSVLGTNVGTRIEVLADGDVRLALRMTREFLESGYTDPAKALSVRQQGKAYVLPKHEALRSIMLGNRNVYSEQYSVIGNPFDSRLAKSSAQLLRLFVLNALVGLSSDRGFRSLDGPTIKEECNKVGYSDDYLLRVLADLCRLNFAHTSSHGLATFDSGFFPSRLGGHVVRDLICDMTFVENVMMDTFIDETSVWTKLRSLSDEVRAARNPIIRLNARVDRVKCFFDHMVSMYSPIIEEAQRRGLPGEWCTSPLTEARVRLWEDCDKAKQSAGRSYPTGGGVL